MLATTIGKKVEIYPQDFHEQKQWPYVSQVQEFVDENHIKISAPIQKGMVVPLQLYQPYEFVFYTSKGLWSCMGTIIHRDRLGDLHLMTVGVTLPLKKVQRRSFYRMSCILPFQYKDENKEIHTGIIKDVSGGGFRFINAKELALGQIITSKILLSPTQELHIKGKILSGDQSYVELYPYEYRVQFIEVDSNTQDLIIEYIFQEERKRR
ncbi:MAG: flagellar brake protein, partial [Epulopiscium sp.]|nr:flagellar brake protein [Candidatus Epulonipiscium sp.]